MWYRTSQQENKQRPLYELKVLAMDAAFAVRRLLYLQQNYKPSEVEVMTKVKKVFSSMEEKYNGIANIRLYTKGDNLQGIVTENVNELFGKHNKR